MRFHRAAALAVCVLTGSVLASGRMPVLSAAQLRPTFGGVLLETTVVPRAGAQDELLGAWTPGSRAKLMACLPRCREVESIPVTETVRLGAQSKYRVVLGGNFAPGQKVGLLLSFRSGVRPVEVTVVRGAAFHDAYR